MKGAIFFRSKYGSTAEYADWIAEETGLPAFDVTGGAPEPDQFDFLVIVTPIYYYKPLMRDWLVRHLGVLTRRPCVLVTVSGAPAGDKLDGWLEDCLPASLRSRMTHFALRGRQRPSELSFFHRMMLRVASSLNSDPSAAKEEAEGFDYMDRLAIEPAVARIRQLSTRDEETATA